MNGQIDTHNGFRDRVEVNVSRPASYAQLAMSSEDRYANPIDKFYNATNGANFVLQSKQPFLSGYFTRLAIPSISMKYAVPTIISGKNDVLLFKSYSLSAPTVIIRNYAVAFSTGFYNAFEARDRINAIINSTTNTAGVVCSVVDGALAFNCSAGYGIVFTAGSGTSVRTSRCWNVMGIPSTAVDVSTGTYGYAGVPLNSVFCSPFQTNYTTYVDITSASLTKYQSVKDNMTRLLDNKASVIARIYMTPFNQKEYTDDYLNQGDVSGASLTPSSKTGAYNITTDYNNAKWIKWNPDEYIYQMDIQLWDDYGEPLYWTPTYNTEFDMTILASES
jgi:hypothetical protein